MEKRCPKCKQTKDLSMFYKSSILKHGVQTYCKKCHNSLELVARQRRKEQGPTIVRDSKVCQLCKNKKPISQFGKRTNSADGKLSYCKPCWTIYVQKAKAKQKMV